jgi:[acyl-carrier-protein] S-malonyltransferase
MAEYTPTFLGSVLKAIACTPNKNFDQQAYEAGVLEPARRIRKLWDELGEQRPSDEQIREVMQLLLQIFETKMVDGEERDDRLRDILDRHKLHPLFPELLPLRA